MIKAIHFSIQELIDQDTFGTHGEESWNLLHPDAITMLDGIREFFNLPITVNNWKWGGQFQYRGYRPPHCQIGAQGSYHKRGMAFDFDVKGMTAEEVRQKIVANQNNDLLRLIQRMEANVNWVHVDLGLVPRNASRIYLFRV